MNVWITLCILFPISRWWLTPASWGWWTLPRSWRGRWRVARCPQSSSGSTAGQLGVNFELQFDILWNTVCNINFVSRKNDLYMIPHFNTILYLHHKVTYWWVFWFCLDFLLGKVHLVDNHFIPILQNFLITFCWTQTTTTVWWQTVSNNCMPTILNTI